MKTFYASAIRACRVFLFISIVFFSNSSKSQPTILLNPVIQGLVMPIQFVNAADGTKRIFIVEKGGDIKVFDADYNLLGKFLTVTGVANDNERGLLSVAFHPNYRNNGYLYTYYTNGDGDLELTRYHVSNDANTADPGSRTVLINIPHPGQGNHNGGEMHFGRDGFLYFSTGDGGGSGDPNNNAQNTSKLLGKILRIDVDNPSADSYYSIPPGNPYNNEIFALGLRNPFRWSFDRQTGDMWIGDVGQESWEEIDFAQAPTGGENFGWRCYEGNATYNNSVCNATYHNALYTYPTQSPASVIGGVVYRGSKFPSLNGIYIAADYFSGNFYKINASGAADIQANLATGIADFGENEDGEVYAVSLNAGTVSLVTDVAAAPLPVTLVTFKAVPEEKAVTLYWSTSSEQNAARYEIEFSGDGNNFALAGSLNAANTSAGHDYQFTHTYVRTGKIFYRLKIVDIDGQYYYSNIIAVLYSGSRGQNFVYPSVVRKGSPLIVFTPESFITLDIINTNGALIRRENLGGRTGRIEVAVPFPSSGIYYVQLKNNEKSILQKIVITD